MASSIAKPEMNSRGFFSSPSGVSEWALVFSSTLVSPGGAVGSTGIIHEVTGGGSAQGLPGPDTRSPVLSGAGALSPAALGPEPRDFGGACGAACGGACG